MDDSIVDYVEHAVAATGWPIQCRVESGMAELAIAFSRCGNECHRTLGELVKPAWTWWERGCAIGSYDAACKSCGVWPHTIRSARPLDGLGAAEDADSVIAEWVGGLVAEIEEYVGEFNAARRAEAARLLEEPIGEMSPVCREGELPPGYCDPYPYLVVSKDGFEVTAVACEMCADDWDEVEVGSRRLTFDEWRCVHFGEV